MHADRRRSQTHIAILGVSIMMNKLKSIYVAVLFSTMSTLVLADPRCGFELMDHHKEITTQDVLELNAEITRVVRFDDGSWLFSNYPSGKHLDIVGVTIEELVKRDPSLCSLYDMPAGWVATRVNKNESWIRTKSN